MVLAVHFSAPLHSYKVARPPQNSSRDWKLIRSIFENL